jgi:hypothetical protein
MPVKVVVLDPILVVVRHEGCLRAGGDLATDKHEQEEGDPERRS